MGFGSEPNIPDAGDYQTLAYTQAGLAKELLREQTAANRPNQYTPYGSSLWRDLGGGQWEQRVTLPENVQAGLEAQQRISRARSELGESLMGRAGEELGRDIGWEAMAANEVGTAEQARDAAEEAIYGRTTSRLDPQWEQRSEAMETRLWQQGLRPGDEAWDTAMANLGRERTDAYQTAMREAIIGGGAEAQRTFGMDMARRQQAIAETLQRRGWSVNEINALLSGQQVGMPSMPGFTSAGRAQAPDLLGAAQAGSQNALDIYNARQMRDQSLLTGATGLGTAAMFAFSDRRLKSNVKRIGATPGGQPVYSYRIFGRDEIGVMADESPPEAVLRHPSGYLMVDYSRIQ